MKTASHPIYFDSRIEKHLQAELATRIEEGRTTSDTLITLIIRVNAAGLKTLEKGGSLNIGTTKITKANLMPYFDDGSFVRTRCTIKNLFSVLKIEESSHRISGKEYTDVTLNVSWIQSIDESSHTDF
ncbi:MAG: hypothetical protein CMO81_03130 [Waddliaceae bacterium]|nr:hypothetical protein [Waddliaceae bacterium]